MSHTPTYNTTNSGEGAWYEHTRDRAKDVQGPTLVELEVSGEQPDDYLTFTAESGDAVTTPNTELQAAIDRNAALKVITDGLTYS